MVNKLIVLGLFLNKISCSGIVQRELERLNVRQSTMEKSLIESFGMTAFAAGGDHGEDDMFSNYNTLDQEPGSRASAPPPPEKQPEPAQAQAPAAAAPQKQAMAEVG